MLSTITRAHPSHVTPYIIRLTKSCTGSVGGSSIHGYPHKACIQSLRRVLLQWQSEGRGDTTRARHDIATHRLVELTHTSRTVQQPSVLPTHQPQGGSQ